MPTVGVVSRNQCAMTATTLMAGVEPLTAASTAQLSEAGCKNQKEPSRTFPHLEIAGRTTFPKIAEAASLQPPMAAVKLQDARSTTDRGLECPVWACVGD